jgi:hypothetical protein
LLVCFRAFLGKESSNDFAKSPMSKKIHKNPQNFQCQFLLNFFCFIAVSGVS